MGAIAVAAAAALAWQLRHEPAVTGAAFLERVLPWVPAIVVRERIVQTQAFDATASRWTVVRAVGNGSAITARGTVPFCLWCAARQVDREHARL